jgi:zeaxanthin glucosyltransferase
MNKKNIGFICTGDAGHINPALALASELNRRNYSVIFYQVEDTVHIFKELGLRVQTYATRSYPKGAWHAYHDELSQLTGINALRFNGEAFTKRIQDSLNDLPILFSQDKLDIVLVDQSTPESASIAEAIGIPHVTISYALLFNQSNNVPPYFSNQEYLCDTQSRIKYRDLNRRYNQGIKDAITHINNFRRAHNLQLQNPRKIGLSNEAQICQQHRAFEFPRTDLSDKVHFVGLFSRRSHTRNCELDFVSKNKKIIYASLGTLQNGIKQRFWNIAEACRDIDAQLIISLGGRGNPSDYADLPGNPIVLKLGPQLELLKKASLFITHGGLNSVLESLSVGTPLLAVPITNDQPGVAERIRWTGVGEKTVSDEPKTLNILIKKVLNDIRYKNNAMCHAEKIAQSGGTRQAADIIESVLTKYAQR